ncbi:GNAT family N-acetyltransferase [Streptomyces sp. MRC013]|uniref:GNAT family N-acetyltransferase n=1 Tax=Streptomyces sp. MRC013 TaxID=2898276 RepID=UPI002026F5CA|nr:GNAT family N-acetyltransferase [Streptomyces sp. MRC013]URM89979.1 GNAT family N-acetyltransferase [Streptomyces sp. MRC013]
MVVRGEDGYEIDTAPDRLNVVLVHHIALVHHRLSTGAFWALGRSRETVEQSVRASLGFGVYHPGGPPVAHARVVTDLATFARSCDVYVAPTHRGMGLGTWLAATVRDHLVPCRPKRVLLSTLDAHQVYERVGSVPFPDPQKMMVLNAPGPPP